MTPVLLTTREHHRFEAAGRQFVSLMPSAAMFALDEAADAVLRLLSARARSSESLVRELADGDVESTIARLISMKVIGELVPPPTPKIVQVPPCPMMTMALNVTNQAGLAASIADTLDLQDLLRVFEKAGRS